MYTVCCFISRRKFVSFVGLTVVVGAGGRGGVCLTWLEKQSVMNSFHQTESDSIK